MDDAELDEIFSPSPVWEGASRVGEAIVAAVTTPDQIEAWVRRARAGDPIALSFIQTVVGLARAGDARAIAVQDGLRAYITATTGAATGLRVAPSPPGPIGATGPSGYTGPTGLSGLTGYAGYAPTPGVGALARSVSFLDAICGSRHEAGLPRGAVVLLTGPPGSGKTTLALQTLAALRAFGERGGRVERTVRYVTGGFAASQAAIEVCRRLHITGFEVRTHEGVNALERFRYYDGLLAWDAPISRHVMRTLGDVARRGNEPVLAVASGQDPVGIMHDADVVVDLVFTSVGSEVRLECTKNRGGPTGRIRRVQTTSFGLAETFGLVERGT